jgi:protein-S-isoprenylcysteine O-methyltransferase Ste14
MSLQWINSLEAMNIYILISGTAVIILISWFLSIKHKRYHGITRFFAFESVFILFLMNYSLWFADPFSALHLVSWFFLIFSIYPVVAGFLLLKRAGKPDNNFENTSILVESGIYKYIRHPLYLSVFMLGTGIMLKDPGTVQLFLGGVNTISLFLTALIEEKEMILKFGDLYKDYMKHTRMFVPFIL